MMKTLYMFLAIVLFGCNNPPTEPTIVIETVFITDTLYVYNESDPFEHVSTAGLNYDEETGLFEVSFWMRAFQRQEGIFTEVRAGFKVYDVVDSTRIILDVVIGPLYDGAEEILVFNYVGQKGLSVQFSKLVPITPTTRWVSWMEYKRD